MQTAPTAAIVNNQPPLIENSYRLRHLNPGWQVEFYDDEKVDKFIQQHYAGNVSKAFNRIAPEYGAARADFFRYLYIYEKGGIYLDIKSTCTVPFNDIIKPDDVMLLSHWDNGLGMEHQNWGFHPGCGPYGEYQNWFLIAAPKHPALKGVIDKILEEIERYTLAFGVGQQGTLQLTGPIIYTHGLVPWLTSKNHRLFDSRTAGLVYSILPSKLGLVIPDKPKYTQLSTPIIQEK